MSKNTVLDAGNFEKGLLVSKDFIGGVCPLATGGFAAYVADSGTSDVVDYSEFDALEEALEHLNGFAEDWAYEYVGCGKPDCAVGKCTTCGAGAGLLNAV